jgi:hypothetical protein
MRRLMLAALVAGAAVLTLETTPAAACGGYGYGGCGCGYGYGGYVYSSAYYYRPVYGFYRPAYAYSGFYRPRVWGWGGWGVRRGWGVGRGWGYRGWGGRRW